MRHGMFGTERKVIVNNIFKSLLDSILPKYAKFLLSAASKESEEIKAKMKKYSKYQLSEHFSRDEIGDWEELMGILNTTAEQRRKILEHKESLQREKERY